MDRKFVERIKNEIQLRTTDLDTEEYIDVMREIAEWASNQANVVEYTPEMNYYNE